MAPHRPEATTATAPMSTTTSSAKNHITPRSCHVPVHRRDSPQGTGHWLRSTAVRAEPAGGAAAEGFEAVPLGDLLRGHVGSRLGGGVCQLARLHDVADGLVHV